MHNTWTDHLTTVDLALRIARSATVLACAAHKGDADVMTLRLVELVRYARALGAQLDVRILDDLSALEDAMAARLRALEEAER